MLPWSPNRRVSRLTARRGSCREWQRGCWPHFPERPRAPTRMENAQMPPTHRISYPPRSLEARTRAWNTGAAIVFLAAAMWLGYLRIGLPPVVIVGGSGLVALVIWSRTYLRQ